jgi:hypothetical protein
MSVLGAGNGPETPQSHQAAGRQVIEGDAGAGWLAGKAEASASMRFKVTPATTFLNFYISF